MLKKGPGTVRKNVQELMTQPIQSRSRKRAILTIAKRRNLSKQEAQFVQARAIASSQARKK